MEPRKTPRIRTNHPHLSGKSPRKAHAVSPSRQRKSDRRVKRTRDRLGDALIALMQEKPFESITVQDVLDRAAVGRSTFYDHYKDKNDLFISDAEDFFELMANALSQHGDRSNRVAPVREFLAHVAESQKFVSALSASGKWHDLTELGQGILAEGIAKRLTEIPNAPSLPAKRRSALAHAFAGSLFALLSWWLRNQDAYTPAQVDEMYHLTVWSSLKAGMSRR